MAEETSSSAAEPKVLIFDSTVYLIVRGMSRPGQIKFAAKGIAFRSQKTGKVESFYATDMESAQVIDVARGIRVRIELKSGASATFEGFSEEDLEKIKPYLSDVYKLGIQEQSTAVKGLSFGDGHFNGGFWSMATDGKTAFEIPLTAVTNATAQKHEATLEFVMDDNIEGSDQVVESMRFFLPDTDGTLKRSEAFVDEVREKADITEITGEGICEFAQISCLVPRGRFDINFFASFLHLHGTTHDHKIFYDNIIRVFKVSTPDLRSQVVLNLDPPLRQGSTLYSFVVFQIEKYEEELDLNMDSGDVREKLEAIDGVEDEKLKGDADEVFVTLLTTLTKRKLPKDTAFKSKEGLECVKCSYKASDGYLYPMDKAFLFLLKPVVFIRFSEIIGITFERLSSDKSSRSFDIVIEVRGGGSYEFKNLKRDEYTHLETFLEEKKLSVSGPEEPAGMEDAFGSEESEEDVDFHDKRARREGAAAEDESDESDEDFEGNSDEASDVSEEYDSDEGVLDDLGASEGKDKGKSKKASKGSSRSDDEDEEDEEDEDDEMEDSDAQRRRKKRPKKPSASNGTSKRRKKESKDPNAPKRPLSAYMLFSKDVRDSVKEENPDAAVTDVAKILGERWKNLTDEEKAPYERQAKLEKEKYTQAMKEYKARGGAENQSPQKSRRSPKKKPAKSSATKAVPKSAEYIEDSDED